MTAVVAAMPLPVSRSPSALLLRKLFRRKLVLAGAVVLVIVTVNVAL